MTASGPDRGLHGQLVVDSEVGDCFRACMSVLLDVPNGDHLPNEHGRDWWVRWQHFLDPMGLALDTATARGPIWKHHPWIASVPSKNMADRTHAIVMHHGGVVRFDPSPRRRYHTRRSLLGADVVLSGTWLEVDDASRLHRLVDWQREVRR